jgi:tetratricopeptide (TPR) repeat protein
MKKTQIIFLSFAIVLIVVLYSLPTIVVDNSSDGIVMEDNDLGNSMNLGDQHSSSLSPEAQAMIERLKGEMDSEESKEKLAIFADSTAAIYAERGKLDSAAYFYGLSAEYLPGEDKWEIAGNAYYEAFGFSMDEGKTQNLASKTRLYLNKVLERNPERLDLKTKVAMTYVSTTNPMQGITMLREILEQDPKNESALFNMGVLSMQSGQYKRAVERFEELVMHYPSNIEGQFYLGVSYFESNQKNKAKKQFENLKPLTSDPQIQTGIENYLDRL